MTDMRVVYVLTNPAMPNLVKIGRTDNEDAATRLAQLYTTGVPFPFKLEFSCRVPNADEVERALHRAFAPHRVNPRREFFSIDADQAIAILKLLHVEDTTAELRRVPNSIEQQEVAAAEEYQRRRPNLNFVEMGIPISSVLQFTESDATATVVGPRKIRLNDEEMSLTAATRQLLGLDYSVQPGKYWRYQGKSLGQYYEETYTT